MSAPDPRWPAPSGVPARLDLDALDARLARVEAALAAGRPRMEAALAAARPAPDPNPGDEDGAGRPARSRGTGPAATGRPFRIPDAEYQAALAAARANGETLTDVVRRALAAYVATHTEGQP